MKTYAFLRERLPASILIALVLGLSYGGYRYSADAYTMPAPEKGVHHVLLKSDRAEPDALAVPVGEYVQMNAADGKTHNMGYGSGDDYGNQHEHIAGVLDSGDFHADEAYRVLIKEPGTYYFHDHLNPKVYLTVVGYVPEP